MPAGHNGELPRHGTAAGLEQAGRGNSLSACGLGVPREGGLGVLSGQVRDAAGGWEAAEGGVSAVMLVDVEPGVKGVAALGF